MKKIIFDDEEFVKKYDELKSSYKMGKYFGCSPSTITNHAKEIGYVNNYRISLSDKQKQEIINQYYDRKAVDLAKEYNCSKSLIIKIWMNAGIDEKKIRYIYPFNQDFFEKIEKPEQAYFLGFLASDGNIFKRKNNNNAKAMIKLSLQERDKDILSVFKTYINSEKPLNIIRRREKDNNLQDTVCLEMISDKMADDLSKYGIIERKTYTIITPSIPKELYSHYIRGYFDGDGCITVYKEKYHTPSSYNISIVGFMSNMQSIQKILNDNNIKANIEIDNREYNLNEQFVALCLTNNEEKYKFLKYIYQDCKDLYLSRKKFKADAFINAVENNFSKRIYFNFMPSSTNVAQVS